MKTCFKISLFLLLALLSPFGELECKTILDSSTVISELVDEQPKILEKGLIDLKIISSDYDTNEFLAEEEIERRKRTKKKSPSTAYLRDTNSRSLTLLKFISVQKLGGRFIQSKVPFYKLYHSWKTHLL